MQPLILKKPVSRRDPAPSRTSYRMQRLWLTPLFRAMLRVGLPVFAVVLGVGWYFADEGNREAMSLKVSDLRRSLQERPEFMVQLMAIDGASAGLSDDIREVVPLDFPISSFELDLVDMHANIAGLDAVKSVEIRVRKGGVLQVDVTERQPWVVWRNSDGIGMLDETGHPVAPLQARLERPDLPLIAGDGANLAVPEALQLLAVAGPISDRIRGLVRVGERRWDVVVEPDIRLMLPEVDPVPALERIIALEQAQELLQRDIVAVDLRNSRRPTLRMAQPAVESMRQIKAIETGAVKP